jgi:hypothetical protein
MENRRVSNRSYTYAKVVFLDLDIIAYLRDISKEGIRLEVFDKADLKEGQSSPTTIIPHQDLKINPFNVESELRWIGENGPTLSLGLRIVSFADETAEHNFSRLREFFFNHH